jgi:hypothetical protein
MNERPPLPPGYVVKSDAQVFQPRLIEVIEAAVRPGGVNQRGDRVDEKLIHAFGGQKSSLKMPYVDVAAQNSSRCWFGSRPRDCP